MSGKSDPGDQWRQTSVVIRSDIWLKAVEMGLDISDELNQRLAGRLGIEYRHEQLADRPLPESIVGAADSKVKRETESRQKPQTPVIHPVINADDPAAATKVRKAKRQAAARTRSGSSGSCCITTAGNGYLSGTIGSKGCPERGGKKR